MALRCTLAASVCVALFRAFGTSRDVLRGLTLRVACPETIEARQRGRHNDRASERRSGALVNHAGYSGLAVAGQLDVRELVLVTVTCAMSSTVG